MGATGLGATSYALSPRECPPPGQQRPPLAAGGPVQPQQECRTRSSSSGSYGGSRWSSYSGGSIWDRSSTKTAAALSGSGSGSSALRMSPNISTSPNLSGGTSVARGGFGSTGHSSSYGG